MLFIFLYDLFEISAWYRWWSNLTLKCYANTIVKVYSQIEANREGVQALPLFVRQFSQKHVLA